jgi:hypothetical protein
MMFRTSLSLQALCASSTALAQKSTTITDVLAKDTAEYEDRASR